MVRWVIGSILHGGSYSSFQPVLHDWCNKGCDMCYPVCGMVHLRLYGVEHMLKDHSDSERKPAGFYMGYSF